ncbi:hypothetical protein [Ideonella sp. A 288]|uniref:hypothetical protein n=1 Tax=Ideonella sp. A 288 TaxID=1962181 RepID=UPI000B4B8EC0|nr:hypothetical protein [Ideonella sp. A 288]
MTRKPARVDGTSASSLQFIPVVIAPAPVAATSSPVAPKQAEPPVAEEIRVELTRGATQLCVRWPSAQAAACAAWLRELANSVRIGNPSDRLRIV